MRQRPLLTMVVAGAIAAALMLAIVLSIHWFPPAATPQAREIQRLWKVLLICSVPLFALVVTVVITSVIRFRMRPGQEDMDGPPIHGNARLEVFWSALPATLLLSLCTYSYIVLTNMEAAPAATPMSVDVLGRQFAWSFTYPASITHGAPLTTDELWLPAGRPVHFNIRSSDVIHSFWVPNFGPKKDAVPGLTTHIDVTPDRLGTYPVICNELCGIGHSTMRATLRIVTPQRFASWLSSQQRATHAAPAAPGQPQPGKQVFTGAAGCSACHALADANSLGGVGPNLDTGLKGKDAAFIRQCILNPNSVAPPGYPKNVMPSNFGSTLTPRQIDDLVAYLHSVTSK